MKTPMEKYHNDPEYHMLVDTIENFIRQAQFTPSEIREACILACTRYELHVFKRFELPPNEAHALDILHNFSHSVQEAYNFRTAHLDEVTRRVIAWPERKNNEDDL